MCPMSSSGIGGARFVPFGTVLGATGGITFIAISLLRVILLAQANKFPRD